MINILSQVTPLTRGLLWLTNGEIDKDKTFYKDVDYLLNGLLTATLRSSATNGAYVLVSENFGTPFYVIVGSTSHEKDIRNYFDLVRPQLSGENNLLLIDEENSFPLIQKLAPDDVKSKINVIK